jgi:hypothetical protein
MVIDLRSTDPVSGESGTTGRDERTDAEEDIDKAEQRHGSLFENGDRVREDNSAGEANGVDVGGDGSEEGKQSDRDGDVHPEHALLWVVGVGHDAKEDEEQTEDCWDQRGGVGAAGIKEAEDCQKDEQDTEGDGELDH